MDGSTYVVQQIHHGPAAGVPPPINLGRNIYDGKRMRKQITRKAVDFTAPAMIYLQVCTIVAVSAMLLLRSLFYTHCALEPRF